MLEAPFSSLRRCWSGVSWRATIRPMAPTSSSWVQLTGWPMPTVLKVPA